MNKYLVLLSVCLSIKHSDIVKLVNLSQGPVRGYLSTDGGFYQFFGIPYATVPKGDQKFKAPLPPPNWTEPFEAVDRSILCYQSEKIEKQKEHDTHNSLTEDCLVVNVFVPKTETTKLPVIVNVHGGAYQMGTGNTANPGTLVKQGTKDVPGNAGLKDQLALLRWVKNNIEAFGGNPEDITLEGCSAGSAAVELLSLIPAANGYFKRVILQSGSGISGWSIQQDPIGNAKTLAAEFGFNFTEIADLQLFYKTQPLEKLFTGQSFNNKKDLSLGFVPCVENGSDEIPVLLESPINLLQKQEMNIPIYMFLANKEGLFKHQLFNKWESDMNVNFSEFLPSDLKINDNIERKEVSQKVKEAYFGATKIDDKSINDFVDYLTDTMFSNSVLRSAQIRINKGADVRVFQFKLLNQFNYKKGSNPYIIEGAPHCSEFLILMDDEKNKNHGMQPDYVEVQTYLRQMMVDFIKTNNPAPKVLPEKFRDYIVEITPYNEEFNSTIKPRFDLWEEIYDKYYYAPMSP